MSQNKESILFNGLQPKATDYVYVCAHLFTRSMTMIETPVMTQQKGENPLVEIVSDYDNMFPNHEIAHDNECNHHIYEGKNHVTNSPKEFTNRISPCRTEPMSLSTRNSSPSRSEKSL